MNYRCENRSVYEYCIFLNKEACEFPLGKTKAFFKFPLLNGLALNSGMVDYYASCSYFEFTESYASIPFKFYCEFGDKVENGYHWGNDFVERDIYANSITKLMEDIGTILEEYDCKVSGRIRGESFLS